jgi:hypothetical protein
VMAGTHSRTPPEPVLQEREASSVAILARRVREVGRAWQVGDEPAVRAELRMLSAEAGLLASMEPLRPQLLDRRLTISAERDWSGRGA